MSMVRVAVASLSILLSCAAFAQSSYTATFEPPTFSIADVNGQDGWTREVNSPTDGFVVGSPAGTPAQFGSQVLALVGSGDVGVQNHQTSARLSRPAGETGSLMNGGAAVDESLRETTFRATVWFRTPVSTVDPYHFNDRIAELNPASKAPGELDANRYAQVRIHKVQVSPGVFVPTVEIFWYAPANTVAPVGTLEWESWYRFEYEIELVDGTDGAAPNDRFVLTVFDIDGNRIGSACGSTWELGYRANGWAGTPGPLVVNAFDFWSYVDPGVVAYHIDNVSLQSDTPPALSATITGTPMTCSGGTTTLSVSASNAAGDIVSYQWRDAADTVVGSGSTFDAGPGTYTVRIVDEMCRRATSAQFVVNSYAPVAAAITGSTSVCFGGTTTLTANPSGGSGAVSSYTWRDASNAIVGNDSTLSAGVGTYTVTIVDAECGSATSAPVTVEKTCNATPVVTWSNPDDIVYGTLLSATQLNATANVPGTFTYTPPAGTLLNAGPAQVLSVDFTPDDAANYDPVNGTTVQINVLPATPTVIVTGGTFAYDGLAHAASAVAEDSASNPVTGTIAITYDGSATVPVDAGTYAVVATFTSSDPNFTDASGNGSLTITPAVPAITVTGGTFPYDGLPHAASAVARDGNGDPVSGSFTFTYDGVASVPVDAGTYAVIASFTSADPNFGNASGNGSITIEPVTPVVTVTGGTFPYDGGPHPASAVARDADGNVVAGTFTFSYDGGAAAPVDAGTYAVIATFTSGDPNFTNASGNGSVVIEPATPVVTVTGGSITYDGTPHAATAVARDSGGAVVPGTFTFTYNGSATAPTNAGTYAVVASFTSSDPNFTGATGNGTLTIVPAVPIISVTGGTFVYDGSSHSASATARDQNGDPVAGTFTFTYDGSATAPTNAGTYAVVASFTSSDPNFADATGNATLVINPATPVVTVTGGTFTYDGTPHSASAVARDAGGNPIAGTFSFTYDGSATAPTNTGTYAVVASFTSADPNFANASGNGTLVINPATALVTVTGGTFPYDGTSHSASAVARDAGGNPIAGTFSFTYDGSATAPTNAGTYAVVASFTSSDPNFMNATGNGTLVIDPATPVVTVTGGTFTYDGTQHTATAVARDAGGNPIAGTFSFTYDGSAVAPTNAGTYAVVASFTSSDPNFTNAIGNGTLVIDPATPLVTVTGGTFTYDGTAHSATAVARNGNGSPVTGTFAITYDGSATAPTNAGTYAVVATFTSSDPNFTGATGNGTLVILRAPTTIAITSFSPAPSTRGETVTVTFTIEGTLPGATGTTTVSNGDASCTAPAGATSCALIFNTAGTIGVSATYSGDVNHLPSTTNAFHSVESLEAAAQVSRDATVCSGASSSIRVDLSGDAPWTLTWSDGLVERVTLTPHFRSVSPTETTTYTLTAISDANGAGAASGSAVITVTTIARPAISGPLGTRLGEPLTLRATPGLGTYRWFRNGVLIPGATTDTLTIAAVTEADLASYTVVASSEGCSSSASVPFALVLLGLPTDDDAVIPVVGRAPGANGSYFRTTLHLVNATEDVMEGEITFIDPSLPAYPYELEPGETRFVEDLLPEAFEGLTSANIRRERGPLPVVVAHVFNDDDEGGTSGMIERAIPLALTLEGGDQAVLVTPIDPVTTRFNVGMRSLSDGFAVRVTQRNRDGVIIRTFERQLAADRLVHEAAGAFAGGAVGSSDSLTFEVLSGRGVVYGAATDNGTNDPNMQVASRQEPAAGGRYVLPVAGATAGMFDSRFATGLQLHNPSDASITATVRFHPAGASGTDADPQLVLTVPARGTIGIEDVVTEIGASGLGSIDLTIAENVRPLLLARIYSIADAGQTSLMTELLPEEEALGVGETGVFAAPAFPGELRFNIGVRTLAAGARATATVRSAAGDVVRIVPLTFPPTWFLQTTAASLLGVESFAGNESVTFTIDEGSAIFYGVWTDNVTQDPAMQIAVRP